MEWRINIDGKIKTYIGEKNGQPEISGTVPNMINYLIIISRQFPVRYHHNSRAGLTG